MSTRNEEGAQREIELLCQFYPDLPRAVAEDVVRANDAGDPTAMERWDELMLPIPDDVIVKVFPEGREAVALFAARRLAIPLIDVRGLIMRTEQLPLEEEGVPFGCELQPNPWNEEES